jgi:hypothetical protein
MKLINDKEFRQKVRKTIKPLKLSTEALALLALLLKLHEEHLRDLPKKKEEVEELIVEGKVEDACLVDKNVGYNQAISDCEDK